MRTPTILIAAATAFAVALGVMTVVNDSSAPQRADAQGRIPAAAAAELSRRPGAAPRRIASGACRPPSALRRRASSRTRGSPRPTCRPSARRVTRRCTRGPTRRSGARCGSTLATSAPSPRAAGSPSPVTTSAPGSRSGAGRSGSRPTPRSRSAVTVDALVELGRYDEAATALQRMVDLKPNLAAYARVSYFRELHGDLDGALRRDVAGGQRGGRGDGERRLRAQPARQPAACSGAGRPPRGGRTVQTLARLPDHVPAQVGAARVDAAQRPAGRRHPAPEPRRGAPAAARARHRAGRGRARRRPDGGRPAHARARRRPAPAARSRGRQQRRRARALRGRPRQLAAGASSWPGGRGRPRRACDRPTPSAGRSHARGGPPRACAGRAGRCGSARPTPASSSTRAWPRGRRGGRRSPGGGWPRPHERPGALGPLRVRAARSALEDLR